MADSIQNSFSNGALIEGWNVENEETLLIMLNIVAQINQFPQAIKTGEEANTELLSLIRRAGCVQGSILEDDFRLRQILPQCAPLPKQDKCCIRYAFICNRFAIV